MAHTAVLAAAAPARPPRATPARPVRHARPGTRRPATGPDRRQLARELHDTVIQQVLAAGLTIDSCLADVPAGSALHAKLEQAKQLTAVATRQLRSALHTLTEDAGADEADLPDMLERLLTTQRAHRLRLCIQVAGTPVPLPVPVRRSLYCVASECVFNAAVHAGARRAVIGLSYGCGGMTLSVADDGHGRPETLRQIIRGEVPGAGGGYHFGLADMALRAAELGWTLRVSGSDLGGIAVEVQVPLPVSAHPERLHDG
jgi:signal transduction histidine kinase